MTAHDVARALEHSAVASAVRDSIWGYAILITLHVLGLGMFLGTVMLLDLRLIRGRAEPGPDWAPLSDYLERVLPWSRSAFALMATSGALLFCTEAVKCYESAAFRVKITLMLAAGVNIWIFHRRTFARWDGAAKPPLPMKLAGIFSLLLWIGTLAVGRAVGYDY